MKPVGEHVTMPCDIETRQPQPERKAAWHEDCPYPDRCARPAHDRDSSRVVRR